jgi:lipid-A-disaccharide synthase-like uncharacterized protein
VLLAMILNEVKQWVVASMVTNPREWSLGIGVPGLTFAFSLVPTLDMIIKLLQILSLLGGLVFLFYQIRKARKDSLLHEKETPSDLPTSTPDGV